MRRVLLLVAASILACGVPGSLRSATIHVPADYPTIQAGVEMAVTGDLVLVAPGTYVENVDFLYKSIEVVSEMGPAVTTIDGSGLTHGPDNGTTVTTGGPWPGSLLSGFTITGGTGTRISTYRWGGGVLSSSLAGTPGTRYAVIDDCIIVDNTADLGGGIAVSHASMGTIQSCRVLDNHAVMRGGGLWFNQTQDWWDVVGCLIANNVSDTDGGGVHVDFAGYVSGPMDIQSCTIVGNASMNYRGGGVFLNSSAKCDLTGCIISHSTTGQAVYCEHWGPDTGEATLTCCDVFGNVWGDWVGCIFDQYGLDGNICEDPLYCADANPAEPYALRENSPCLPAYNSCGVQIGAFGAGCEPYSSTVGTSWGTVKAMYR